MKEEYWINVYRSKRSIHVYGFAFGNKQEAITIGKGMKGLLYRIHVKMKLTEQK